MIKLGLVNGDDWKGLYNLDTNTLIMEGHHIELYDMIGMGPVEVVWHQECDFEWLGDRGSMPDKLEEVKFA